MNIKQLNILKIISLFCIAPIFCCDDVRNICDDVRNIFDNTTKNPGNFQPIDNSAINQINSAINSIIETSAVEPQIIIPLNESFENQVQNAPSTFFKTTTKMLMDHPMTCSLVLLGISFTAKAIRNSVARKKRKNAEKIYSELQEKNKKAHEKLINKLNEIQNQTNSHRDQLNESFTSTTKTVEQSLDLLKTQNDLTQTYFDTVTNGLQETKKEFNRNAENTKQELQNLITINNDTTKSDEYLETILNIATQLRSNTKNEPNN